MSNALKQNSVVKFSLFLFSFEILFTKNSIIQYLAPRSIVYLFPPSCSYGDKTPKSLPARIYSAVWMIVGMIILSIFTAEVTSGLMSKELKPLHTYFGKKVSFLPSHLLCVREMI